jgi:hypothetical protein
MSITYNQQLCYVVPKKPYTLAGRSPSAIIWREILARNFGAKMQSAVVPRAPSNGKDKIGEFQRFILPSKLWTALRSEYLKRYNTWNIGTVKSKYK